VRGGLQPERTSLAWRRTALSVAVGSLVGMRVLPPHLGAWGEVTCVLGLVWSLDLAVTARRRYRQADATVRATGGGDVPAGPSAPAPGPALARAAAATLVLGVAALVGVVVIALT
jgi:hypothetical protein